MSLLDRLDAAIDGRCACECGRQLDPNGPSAYFAGQECQTRWNAAQATNPGDVHLRSDAAPYPPGPMRWRPDLVNAADDADLIEFDTIRSGYTGPYTAQVFGRRSQPTTWHLRLNDGHRFVGDDLADVHIENGLISEDLAARIMDLWRRLERDLRNPRHAVPDDPWPELWSGQRYTMADAAREAVEIRLLGLCRPSSPPRDARQPARMPLDQIPWRRCPTCQRRGVPIPGRIPAPLRLSWTPEPVSEQPEPTPCQICPHCRNPYPGPPLTLAFERDVPLYALRIRMTCAHDGNRYGHDRLIGDDELESEPNALERLQQHLEECERGILAQLGISLPDEVTATARQPQPAPWVGNNLHRLTGVPVIIDTDLPADAVEIRDRDTDRPRIHVGRNDFTPTPEVETFLRERHEQMERRAGRLLQQWRANELLAAQMVPPTAPAWIRVTGA
ncbi:hypothetical protein [Polymorphospora lycopeni]|uniref:Uncharacterized protein n=1 Tax=Polymorphospora lycopeni TaxID=3140240 RepID=A0ABV5CKT3_9ACTN